MTGCGGVVEVNLNGVWTDLSDRVDDERSALQSQHGRQTALVDPDPSTMTLVFTNHDHALTPGNTTSPYYPYFDAGAQIRWTETISATTVDHFHGTMQAPVETVVTDEVDGTTESYVSVSCVDGLTDLDGGEPFISTLAEWIRYKGGPALAFYAPYNDMPSPADLISNRLLTPTKGSSSALFGGDLSANSGGVALADDINSALLVADAPGRGLHKGFFLSPSPQPALATGDTVTVVAWVNPVLTADPAYAASSPIVAQISLAESTPSANGVLSIQSSSGVWQAAYSGGGKTGSVNGRNVQYGDPQLIAVRYGFNPAVLELWIGSDVYTGSLSGSAPASAAATLIQIPPALPHFRGALSHAQVYVGDAADWTHADYLEQMLVGLLALDRQTVGDRLAMVAGMAGVDPSNVDFEDSDIVMQPIALAGATPGAILRNAAATDTGPLFGVPSGKVTFQSRTHRYYGADTPVEIPFSWLAQPLSVRRDPPLNVISVTQTGGPTFRTQDQASIDAYKRGVFSAELNTATAADITAYANFIKTFYGSPRSRLDELVFELDGMDEVDQLTVLQLQIGDRIAITDTPSGWPPELTAGSIEGRQMVSDNGKRTLTLKASPVIGVAPGVPGPWFTLDTSVLGGSDVVPF